MKKRTLFIAILATLLSLPLFAGNNLREIHLKVTDSNLMFESDNFFAYYWSETNGADAMSTKMTRVSEGHFVVAIEVTFTKIMFLRLHPDYEELNWEEVWNRTDDLELSDEYDLYTVTARSSSTGRYIGSWSVYGEGGEGGGEEETDAIPLTVDVIAFDYYPSFNPKDGFDYSLYVYSSDKESNYMPQVVLDIQTTTHKDFVGEYSATKGNIILKYSYIYLESDNELGYELLSVTDASCTISLKNNKYTVKGSVTDKNSNVYTFDVTAEAWYTDAEHMDEPETPQTLDFEIEKSGVVDNSDFANGIITAYFVTTDGKKIYLSYKTGDKETKSPRYNTREKNITYGADVQRRWTLSPKTKRIIYIIHSTINCKKKDAKGITIV